MVRSGGAGELAAEVRRRVLTTAGAPCVQLGPVGRAVHLVRHVVFHDHQQFVDAALESLERHQFVWFRCRPCGV